MTPVHVVVFHPEAGPGSGPLAQAVATARAASARRHARGFGAAGADVVTIVAGPPDGLGFGERLGAIARDLPPGAGLVVLGSGAIPLATTADRRRFVAAAVGGTALANNRYSADVVAIPAARSSLEGLPASTTDNALPRWLHERRGIAVADLRERWRLAIDIDGPLELVLLGGRWASFLAADDRTRVETRLDGLRGLARDPAAELLVAGRTSAASLAWLERTTEARTRALVEERGMRTRIGGQRPVASILGALLERDGAGALGDLLARFADGALVDSRVLLAHHAGGDPAWWPSDDDRFASDLLLHERIRDPWLRDLTRSATDTPIPVLLGGHTLVGPGLRLALGPAPVR